MRFPERLDGPAVRGSGIVGDLVLPLPGVLLALPQWYSDRGDWTGSFAGVLESLPSPGPMVRALRLGQGSRHVDLTLPVPTAEVLGGNGTSRLVGNGIAMVRWPASPDEVQEVRRASVDLVIWSNARQCMADSQGFVRSAIDLRSSLGPSPVVWAPRVATPGRLAFLHSLGIDLLDTIEGVRRASAGEWVYAEAEDVTPEMRLDHGLCNCRSCVNATDGLEQRVGHVLHQYQQEEARVRSYLAARRLRELVEIRAGPEPRRGEWLRHADTLGFDFLEQHAPVVGHGTRPYGTRESLGRPEVRRFVRRFLEHYAPPPAKRVLVLVPCSYTKPYASSPTHRKFSRCLASAGRADLAHVVSVTSPLGLVPRELESVYPARHYDIPVTGSWDEVERDRVREALRCMRERGKYTRILVHLPAHEYRWLSDLLPESDDVRWTVSGERTTAPDSLAALTREARNAGLDAPSGIGPMSVVRQELESIARFQFTAPIASHLFEGRVRLSGRPWFQHLFSEDHHELATWKEETGLWRLTVPGAERIFPVAEDHGVEVHDGIDLRGDLFAPGAIRGGRAVRVGGDVILHRDHRVLGVGEAQVPGTWMGQVPRGIIVKVRHRAHSTTSSPPSPDRQSS